MRDGMLAAALLDGWIDGLPRGFAPGRCAVIVTSSCRRLGDWGMGRRVASGVRGEANMVRTTV